MCSPARRTKGSRSALSKVLRGNFVEEHVDIELRQARTNDARQSSRQALSSARYAPTGCRWPQGMQYSFDRARSCRNGFFIKNLTIQIVVTLIARRN